MKKLLSLVLAMVMLMACAAPALADEGSEPDWTEYDALVAEIKSTTDFVEREALLHKAEDMLMATYAVVPLYYYNDLYLQKSNVDGIYANLFQTKFFAYATKTGDNADTLAREHCLRARLPGSCPEQLRGRRLPGRAELLRSVHL